jgi:hypothetical protein
MKEFRYTKSLGIIIGVLTILGAFGFGILAFIGLGLSKALNSGHNTSSEEATAIILFICLFLIGFISLMVPFWVNRKAGQIFYIGFCFILGIGLVSSFLISFGALGTKTEIFLLCVGVLYLGVGYLAKRKK